jgi:GntR family transcriptional regulator/MocR family aminotransferase
MAKQTRHLELPLAPRAAGLPLHRWLYAELRRAIVEGRLRPGARLPSSRSLARQQSVARATVVAVFEQMRIEGYLASRTGSGTVVAGELPDRFVLAGKPAKPVPSGRTPPAETAGGGGTAKGLRVFQVCEPPADAFPLKLWAQMTARRLRLGGGAALLTLDDPRGYPPLRRAIAAHLSAARSVRCDAERIAIVSGTQQALDLAARLLVRPGDPVWVENPGYIGATGALLQAGAKLVPVAVDDGGLDVAAAIRREPAPRLAYVTPAHQFPLGGALALPRRLALLEHARRGDFRIFEDDYDGEFRYDVRPLGSLQGQDEHGRVIYTGSFNKLLFSSLRLGFVVLPEDLVEPFLALRERTDRFPPALEQAVLADFIAEGGFERHLRVSRALCLERRDALAAAAHRLLRGRLDLQPGNAGFHVVGRLAAGLIDTEVAARAARHLVRVTPLSGLYLENPRHDGLLLGFAATKPAAIKAGVERLARALAN